MNYHTSLVLAIILFQSPGGTLAGQTAALPDAWSPKYRTAS